MRPITTEEEWQAMTDTQKHSALTTTETQLNNALHMVRLLMADNPTEAAQARRQELAHQLRRGYAARQDADLRAAQDAYTARCHDIEELMESGAEVRGDGLTITSDPEVAARLDEQERGAA